MLSFKRLVNAFNYSLCGLKSTFKSEAAFRLEIVAAVVLIPVALMLHVNALSKTLMISSILLALIAELGNTAIEAVVDRISTEQHSLSKKAKDVGSAMVLVALINVVLIWAILLFSV